MIVRQLQQPNVNPTIIMNESIKYAKQSIKLDMAAKINDHRSWYVLGNAHCTQFFSVSHDVMDLKKVS